MVIHGLLALILGIGAFVTVAAFLLILYATIVVTVGSRQEERHRTFLRHRPPSGTAEQARMIVGRYVRQEAPEPAANIPEEALPWYERTRGPSQAPGSRRTVAGRRGPARPPVTSDE